MAKVKKKTAKKKAVKKKTVKRTRTNKKAAPRKKAAKDGTDRGRDKQIISRAMLRVLKSAAALGGNYAEMAASIGIHRDTLKLRREDQSGVQEIIDEGRLQGCIKLKNRAYEVATVPVKDFKPVNWSALQHQLNNRTEFSTQLEINEGQNIPKDVDINDADAVAAYLKMIKKPE